VGEFLPQEKQSEQKENAGGFAPAFSFFVVLAFLAAKNFGRI